MEYQELSGIWKSAGMQKNPSQKINQKLLREVIGHKIKSSFLEQKLTSIFEFVANVLFAGYLISFASSHMTEVKFLIPALAILLMTFFNMGFVGRRLYLIFSIQPALSVLDTQKKLAKVQYMEKLEMNLLYVVIPFLSIPFMVILAKGFLGVDMYAWSEYLFQFFLGSIVVALVLVFILKKFPRKSLVEAMAFMEELKEMEEEEIA
ncbi:hypothetical protein IFO69_07530 [Echinicola sp. CAU 1574]|uniref:DUF3278 domain-containing protein n=1 Tax=Echinicola arenosa TaxID=2774144 RepID=A0ABR9AJ91_9BACT|nr:hypothetical protein [Echinicola arenosa]MBD8488589.1 hypothetical protein [Echinicola arenosa]